MTWFLIVPILCWIVAMTFLLTPTTFYTSVFDKLTRAHWRSDREGLQLMLNHFTQFPDEWSLSRTDASFPKEGSKQIMLNYDKNNGWEYALSSFGGNFRPLNGHFASQFHTAIQKENSRRESKSLVRHLYPELEGQLLLR